jgi:hypothetical protein
VDRPEEALQRKILHQQLSKEIAEHDLAQHRPERELQREPERVEELAIEDEAAVIAGSGKARSRVGREGVPVGEADHQNVDEGNNPENAQNHQRGGKEQPADSLRAHSCTADQRGDRWDAAAPTLPSP